MRLLICVFLCTYLSEQCDFGKYGENCALNCSKNCRPLSRGDLHCNVITGECSEGCRDGYYTPYCNVSCENCPQLVCNNIDGSCAVNCKQQPCNNKPCENKPCAQRPDDKWSVEVVIAVALPSILFICLLGVAVSYCVYRRCYRRRRGEINQNRTDVNSDHNSDIIELTSI